LPIKCDHRHVSPMIRSTQNCLWHLPTSAW